MFEITVSYFIRKGESLKINNNCNEHLQKYIQGVPKVSSPPYLTFEGIKINN